MQYSIPLKSLAFVIHAAGKKDVRNYLNSIYIHGHLCTATNGHFMLRRRDDAQVASAPLLLPRAAVEWAIKATKRDESATVMRGEGRALTIAVAGQSLMCEEVEGKYPDVEAIIPIQDKPLELAGFNGEYLIALARAAKAAGDRYSCVRVEPVGEYSARVDFPHLPGCGGVIMPIRNTSGGRPVVPR